MSSEPAVPKSSAGLWLTRLRTDSARRLLAAVVLSLGSALLVVDYVRLPASLYAEGEVAERDVRANSSFQYVDREQSLERERQAEAGVLPVYDYDAIQLSRLEARIRRAFSQARASHSDALLAARLEEPPQPELSEAALSELARRFLEDLELSLSPEDMQRIVDARWGEPLEREVVELLGVGMQQYVIADRELLPAGDVPLSVVRVLQDGRDEVQLNDYDQIKTPAEVRQDIRLYALETTGPTPEDAETTRAALAVARAAVRTNFSYNQLLTEERRRDKRAQTPDVVVQVKRGTAIVREGDVVNHQQAEMLRALSESRDGYGMVGVLLALFAFCSMSYGSLYNFGASFLKRFSTRPQDVEALAFLSLLTLLLARLLVEASSPLATAVGMGAAPTALWFAVPFAGAAMLVRILINAETALLWVLGTSTVVGLMMDQQVLFALFFAISGVTAAASTAHTRERAHVLRAGVLTGLINAAAALLISLVQVYLGETPALAETSSQPLWDVGAAFIGGVVSAFLVLGMVPIFEMFGFVTDFKLLELANLNHPLLRQLMLRAPGTYHHSMTVASLSEAAAEAIGANALQTRVACYFHDIGKALQPQFFIENQRGGPNPHDRLKPHQSARVIVNHVVDGAAIAEQHQLPQCVLDGILMHHGTSLIKYFYVKALEQAAAGETVDENDFRYPGQRPTSREAGIIFLADRVEAACRTIKNPSAQNFRSMIQKLVNDAITDGQLEECPLTVKELYTIVAVFTSTLQGIHHHRIEYPLLPAKDTGGQIGSAQGATGAIITLEMDNPLFPPHTDLPPRED